MVKTVAHLHYPLLPALLLSALSLPAQAPPQPEPDDQVIRVDVDLVNVFFSARTKKGAYVNDLKQEDLDLYENGVRRDIRYFTRESDLPLTIGLLIDVSRSQENLIQEERIAATQFFREMLRKKDLAFLISFGSDVELLQDLTASANLLQNGLGQLKVNTGGGGGGPTPTTVPSGMRGTVLFEAVWLASKEKLSQEVGRKVMVIITDGVDVGSRTKIEQAIEEAQRADTIIYGILFEDPRYTSPMYGGMSGEGSMKRLSEQTGGRVFRVDRRYTLTDIFKEIQEEVRSQYTLAFSPATGANDGSYRKIELRPKNKDLRIQSRKGYYADKSGR
jgi:VWFA-related protein